MKVFGPIKSRRTSIGYIFHFCQNQISSLYKLPKWSKWSCYDQNIPNRGQQTINIFKSYWRTTLYAVHFFYIFHLCKKLLSCTYQLSKLSKWTCYDQNIPNRRQQTINLFKLYWRTSSYAVHFCPKKRRMSSYAHTFLLHFKFVKTDFLCLQATLSVVLTCFYPKHGSQKPMNP